MRKTLIALFFMFGGFILIACKPTEMLEITTYILTFETNGGSQIEAREVAAGEKAQRPDDPTRFLYDFDDWYADEVLATPFSFETEINEDTTVYADWNLGSVYRSHSPAVHQMNPYLDLPVAVNAFYDYLTTPLYHSDFDWDLAIADGLATEVGDFTNSTVLPTTYVPFAAQSLPKSMDSDGLVWNITLRSDLKFEDGTPINAETYHYSWQQLLSANFKFPNANYLFDANHLPLVNAKAYYEQFEAVSWSEVGFEVLDTYTFRITLTQKLTAYDVASRLSTAVTGVVHPEVFAEITALDGSYGTSEYPFVSYGPYTLSEIDNYYIFTRNEDYFDVSAYRIQYVTLLIADEIALTGELYDLGLLDVANADYTDGGYLDLRRIPNNLSTAQFGLFLVDDFGFDGNPENDNPLMQYKEFRQALYFAIDRENASKMKFLFPSQGFLGDAYYAGYQNPYSYRSSVDGRSVLDNYAPDTLGFDRERALELYEIAYQKAIADGHIQAGDRITLRLGYRSGLNSFIFELHYLKPHLESIFSTMDVETFVATSGTIHLLSDVYYNGWQGLTNDAPKMLQVYANAYDYAGKVDFVSADYPVSVDLPNGKQAVQSWLASGDLDLETTQLFQEFLASFDGNTYFGTFTDLWSVVYDKILKFANYEGRYVEFNRITATLEAILLDEVPVIPFVTAGALYIYSERIGFDISGYHSRLGTGGIRYMYIR